MGFDISGLGFKILCTERRGVGSEDVGTVGA